MRSAYASRPARTWIAIVAAGLVALAVAVAGCGGGGAYGGSSSSAPATAASSGGGGPSVKLASTKLGHVLVDAHGRTLYLFEADHGPTSACDGACASIWPPLKATGEP